MNKIYEGRYLSICYETDNDLFIQNWQGDFNISDFKSEMLTYTKLYKQYKPKNTLWLQQNFSLVIGFEIQQWIETNVNIPCLEYGNEKCAFVVSKDVIAHLSVMDSFDKLQSCIKPEHFLNEKEARDWLYGTLKLTKSKEEKITYEGLDDDGNAIFKIPPTNVKETLRTISSLEAKESFIEKHRAKNDILTKREKEILFLLFKNTKHSEIANSLSISIHTVRTHLKNIKQKLELEDDNSFKDFVKIFYA